MSKEITKLIAVIIGLLGRSEIQGCKNIVAVITINGGN
jgi:hypothetical protein